ncbi:Maf-like protein [Trichothermofontia sichuanensis B231]|uniref:Maf family protein n=1 Tax=Trichothermofontia sichuanensis TaxID=3045816 RepID=UPI00224637AD|nr:nucleoside triphosphate pyrophosphatase [Trichothermofontia sichuanensis]UZQ55595.1 Maf-like protein [Trichothermofontia sichuanensis B231]
MAMPQVVLASASPARRRLLQAIGIDPIVWPSDFDESQVAIAAPSTVVETLARCKATTVADRIRDEYPLLALPPWLVIGCDSVLVINGEIHGKPENAATAIARWQQMRGQVGKLYTGHALIDLQQDLTLVRSQVTQVFFANPTDAQIHAYVATGEPLQCAGCFALEGKGGVWVEKLEGCHTNVIGLSLPLLRQMLQDLGYDVSDFWKAS